MPSQMQVRRRISRILEGLFSSQASESSSSSIHDRKVGFESLKITLRVVESTADVFPPLKSAVGGLLTIINVIELAFQNQKDIEALELRMKSITLIIEKHVESKNNLRSFTDRLEVLLSNINTQLSRLKTKKERSLFRRVAEGGSDASKLAEVHRILSYLLETFMMDTTLSTDVAAQKILANSLLDKLTPIISSGYNASSPTHRHGCTKKTREKILNELLLWAEDITNTKVYWLNGMAGTGKTTIAYTFCETLEKRQMLGASFFCSRTDDATANVNRILPTLAHQLASRFPSIRNSLLGIIEQDPDVAGRALLNQFRNIIADPLRNASSDFNGKHPIIAIEALDECSNQEIVKKLLSIISELASTLPIKFFITSRPEQHIRQSFNRKTFEDGYQKFILHDVEKDVVKADIALYTRERLLEVADGRSDCQEFLDNWPPEDQLRTLVDIAGNLFIYAATACEYIGARGDIRARLSLVTKFSSGYKEGPTAALDTLYNEIVTAAYTGCSSEEQNDISLILRAVVNVYKPLGINALNTLLGMTTRNVRSSLAPLHSVIRVPSSENANEPVSTLHASFLDFISTSTRASREIFLERSESHRILALRCLVVMEGCLPDDICRLSGQPLNSSPLLLSIKEKISDGLAYACTYWVTHIVETSIDGFEIGEIGSKLLSFFDSHVLDWIACLSLIGELERVIISLQKMEIWAQPIHELSGAVMDARRFIIENFEILKDYSVEAYGSALAWLPEKSRIREKYFAKSKFPWNMLMGRRKQWDACEAVLTGHSGLINGVAFSPNSSRIASGSIDKTVRVWNAKTGESELELKGHWGPVTSVAFSPDGSRIVSGSQDNTMRIWNAESGESELELEGHSDFVNTVMFSPNGSRIVSGSLDNTLRVWNAKTGESEMELMGHSDAVYSAVFSPDGSRVVSGSLDKTLRIWNAKTGESDLELKGHSRPVTSVVFSPDGSHVVSGSQDKSMRVWNSKTGEYELELKGQDSQPVTSVAFSPDGSHVVSASWDNTVRIWNLKTRGSELELKGHSEHVICVAFSPDGGHVVSGSWDNTVRIWNARAGNYKLELKGHSQAVTSAAFSPDGNHVVSGSWDNTVRIWNLKTRGSELELKGHSEHVISVAFSPDGSRAASGAHDNTVRIWNAKTGESEMELKGHSEPVISVAFSPDGSNRVVSGSRDNTIRIWNAKTGESELKLKEHSEHISSVAFSPDGSRVVSRSWNHAVRIWDAMTGELDSKLVAELNASQIDTFPDGTKIRRLGEQGFVFLSPSTASGPLIYLDDHFVRYTELAHWCWIPHQYRDQIITARHTAKIVIGYASGALVLFQVWHWERYSFS